MLHKEFAPFLLLGSIIVTFRHLRMPYFRKLFIEKEALPFVGFLPLVELLENAQLAPLNCASRTRRDLTGQAHYNKYFLTFGRFPVPLKAGLQGSSIAKRLLHRRKTFMVLYHNRIEYSKRLMEYSLALLVNEDMMI